MGNNNKLDFYKTNLSPTKLIGRDTGVSNAIILSSYNANLTLLATNDSGVCKHLTCYSTDSTNDLYKKIDELTTQVTKLTEQIKTIENSSSNNNSSSDSEESTGGKRIIIPEKYLLTEEWRKFAEIAGLVDVESLELSSNALNELLEMLTNKTQTTKNDIEEKSSALDEAIQALNEYNKLTETNYANLIVDQELENNVIYQLKTPIKGPHTLYMGDDGYINNWTATFMTSTDATTAPRALPLTKGKSEGKIKKYENVLNHSINDTLLEYTYVKFYVKNIENYTQDQLKKYVAIAANADDDVTVSTNILDMAQSIQEIKDQLANSNNE